MGESETVQLHSFNTFNSFVNSYHNNTSKNGGSNGNGDSSDGGDGKKYKLRLKFDGECALEVVRLNGGHFQVHFFLSIILICSDNRAHCHD
jgi:hypothetical protein